MNTGQWVAVIILGLLAISAFFISLDLNKRVNNLEAKYKSTTTNNNKE